MDFLPDGVAFNKDITYLAKTNFRNQEQVFGIKRKDRRQHIYILGKSGTGKSTLLGNMIVQNIWNGEGVCVVDPHGELVESILATIPSHRVKDVMYFNPADTDYHIGFNVLEIDDPKYKHLVASGLMGIFTKIWANAWSARMEYILNNAILALADTPGSTLLGIPRLLVDKDYRQMVVNNLKDPVIKAFWVHEYETWRDQYRNEAIAPIQNKVGQFLSTAIVRNVVGQAKSTINLFDMMNTGKIFLVNVSKGRIGEDNSALLGGMLITKLQLAAMERVRIPEDERKDFYLYVDEFQNFVTDSFASILSEARKYRLCLTLAHQYIAQLTTKDSDTVRDAVFGNVGTMIIYRVGATDADFLEKEFEPEFTVQDIVALPNYQIYLKLMVDGITSRPFSAKILPPFRVPANSNVANEIIESSRKLYARPREIVEKEINSWSGIIGGSDSGGEGKFKTQCSSCGKDTSVPFEPEPGRPVYCRECIAKIKSGEMKPLKGTRSRSLEPQSFAPLANLGIEFAADSGKPAHRPNNPNQGSNPNSGTASHGGAAAHVPRPNPAGDQQASVVRTVAQSAPANITRPPMPQAGHGRPNGRPPRPGMPAGQRPPNAPAPQQMPHQERTRKGPDHDGLQDILKNVLGNVIGSAPAPKQAAPAPVPVPAEKKTISLATLKKPDAPDSPLVKMQTKSASEGHVSALQNAIAKAVSAKAAEQPAPAVVSSIMPEPMPTPAPVPVPTPEPVPAPKPEPIPEPVPEPKPAASEASLASAPEPIARMPEPPAPEQKPDPIPEPQPEPKAEPKPEPKKPEPLPEQETADPQSYAPKRVREVPEDILRKVLED